MLPSAQCEDCARTVIAAITATMLLTIMSLDVIIPAFCVCENNDADQLRGDREADQRLCFRYTDRTIPLLPIYKISSL